MIIVKNRELLIPANERYIGTPLDNFADNRVFRIKRFSQSGEDLSGLTFRLDLKYPSARQVYTFNTSASHTGGSAVVLAKTFVKTYAAQGTYVFTFTGAAWQYSGNDVDLEDIGIVINFTPVSSDTVTVVSTISTVMGDTVLLTKEIADEYINLLWEITENQTAVPGTVFIALRGSDADASVKYASFYGAFYVETNLDQTTLPASGITELEQLENMTAEGLRKLEYLYNRYQDLNAAALDAEAFARGTRNGYPVGVDDDAYHNNAKYYRQYAERYANGKEDGVPVSSGDGYHDNAKYWSEQANDYSDKSEAYAKGTVDGVPVGSGDPGYHDSSYYWSLISHVYANQVSYKKIYSNVSEMAEDTELVDGQVVRTLGYYTANDGGGALYQMHMTQPTTYSESITNGLHAELILPKEVTPEMFGAKGDGTHDDGEALRNAIIYCEQFGTWLILRDKTYTINSSGAIADAALEIHSGGFKMIGSGGGNTVIKAGANQIGKLHMLYLIHAQDFELSGITIDGGIDPANPASTSFCHGIRLGDCRNITISGCTIQNTSGYGIGQQAYSSEKIYLKNLTLKNTGRDGIDIKNFGDAGSVGTNGITRNWNMVLENIHVINPAINPNATPSESCAGIDIRAESTLLSNILIEGLKSNVTGLRFKETNSTQGTGGLNCMAVNVSIYGDSNESYGTGVLIVNRNVAIADLYVEHTGIGVRVIANGAKLTNATINHARTIGLRVDVQTAQVTNLTIENMEDMGDNMDFETFEITTVQTEGISFRTSEAVFTNVKFDSIYRGFCLYGTTESLQVIGLYTTGNIATSMFTGNIANREKVYVIGYGGFDPGTYYVTFVRNDINTYARDTLIELRERTEKVQISVGYGHTETYTINFTGTYYRILIMAHNTINNLCGIYLINKFGNVYAVVPATSVTVTFDSTNLTVTISNNSSGGTANGVII